MNAELQDDDDYLWSAEGPAPADIAALEHTLGSLRWQGQGSAPPIDAPAPVEAVSSGASTPTHASWWPAVAAGLLALAAVLALLMWLLPGPRATTSDPREAPIQPAGAPDLKDPFGTRDAPGFTTPITTPDPPSPATRPATSPDLKDPFAGRPAAPPKPKPNQDKQVSPDLKDPFAREGDGVLDPWAKPKPKSAPAPKLVDPFSGAAHEVDPRSPDLKDPFMRK